MDLVINTDKVPSIGETITGYGFVSNPGGKGANQAVATKKMGGDVYMVGCIGNEFQKELESSLTQFGVNTTFLRTVNSVSSGIAVITVVNHDNQIILDPGANFSVDMNDIDRFLNFADSGDYVLLQNEIKTDVVEYTLKRSKEKGLITFLNPAPAKQLTPEAFQYCDFIIPNQSESQYYTGIYPNNKMEALESAQKFHKLGVNNVIITLGDQGSLYSSEEEHFKVNAFQQDVIDTTAAGDTFIGAFILKRSQSFSMFESMRYASAAASITVSRMGAQSAIPFDKEVQILLEGIKNEKEDYS